MVLEQKMSAMSEHNSQNAGHSDMVSAHSKKLSLASKLKKQRRIRQTEGADGPVPHEGGNLIGSPARDGSADHVTTTASNYPSKAKSPPRSSQAPASAVGPPTGAAASKPATTGTSSLLHNKRRAMHLAKTRRGGPAKSSAHTSSAKAGSMSTAKFPAVSAGTTSTNNTNPNAGSSGGNMKGPDPYAPYSRKMPASTAVSRPAGLMEPAFTSPKTTSGDLSGQDSHKPKATEREENPREPTSGYDHDVTPVESAESDEYQHYKEDINPTATARKQGSSSRPTTPVKTRAAPKATSTPVSPEPRQATVVQPKSSPVSHQPPPLVNPAPVFKSKPTPVPHQPKPAPMRGYQPKSSQKLNLMADRESAAHRQEETEIAAAALEPATQKASARLSEVAPPVASHEEMVPWDTEEAPSNVVVNEHNNDTDTDTLSHVSTGRTGSVISNGVVDYDESIMSLARLDNFRSKANQSKANKVVEYPGVSNVTSPPARDTSSQVDGSGGSNDGGDFYPISGAEGMKGQHFKPPVQEKKPSPARAQSWKAKSVTSTASFIKRQHLGNRPAAALSSKAKPSNSHQRPSWVKPTTEANTDEAPSSPKQSGTSNPLSNPHPPVSPARSTFSSVSYKQDRPAFSKFSSSRSDIGVETLPVISSLRRDSASTTKSWKPAPGTKKTTFAPSPALPPRQEEVRAASPTPSWHSVRSDPEQESCPPSPAPSQISEAESAGERSESANVPKAKVWAAKKQAPAWMKQRASAPHAPSSPKRPPATWMKPPAQESEAPEPMPVAAPPKTSKFSSNPSIPKPATTIRQNFAAADMAEPARPARSPRRHSSPAPSWVKPPTGENEDTEKKSQAESIPKTKTWAVNKQTPSWMKKKSEEPSEKPPPPVPTTKTWSSKKQTPAWIKQPMNDDTEVAPSPSPRRSSTPSWLKPGQQSSIEKQQKSLGSPPLQPNKDTVASGSPQTPGRSKDLNGPVQDGDASSAKPHRSANQGFMEQRPVPSPRSQSWKPRSPPLTADRTSITGTARRNRHSVGGDVSKLSTASFVKKQRSPSPSVAQLQEQIFVTKLGVSVSVSGDSNDQPPRTGKPQKGPSSPSPQVKQLQQIIFSPDKGKKQAQNVETGGTSTSPAQGWWKRVPNAPEVQTEHCEEPPWKHEASSVCDEQSEISPAPTMMSEPLPAKKTWKRPASASSVAPEAPSFLKDVAAFHVSHSPKLPSEPPLWQQSPPKPSLPQQPDSRTQTPTTTTQPAAGPLHSTSPLHRKLADEGSSELMVVSSSSTTSRDDVVMHQEDTTKSLIQMAADSVLIADYEQAMQRAAVDSKSDEEDDSVGNSAGNTLPSELPLEFQRALTSEEKEDAEAVPPAPKNDEVGQLVSEKQDEKKEDDILPPQDNNNTSNEQHTMFEERQHFIENSVSYPLQETDSKETPKRQPRTQSEPPLRKSSSENNSKAVDVSDDRGSKSKSKGKPNIADRARALLGWAEKRIAPSTPTKEERQPIMQEAVEVVHTDFVPAPVALPSPDPAPKQAPTPASEPEPACDMPPPPPASVSESESVPTPTSVPAPEPAVAPTTSMDKLEKVIVQGALDQVEAVNRSTRSASSSIFGANDPNLTGFEQDENGFPCAPLSEEPIDFDSGDFHADAFGNQEWIDAPEDEKKDASDILQYWDPEMEMDPMNDSSEWVNRDPDLDSIPMHSPEPVSADQVILTAEKMLKKWSKSEGRNAGPMAPQVFTNEKDNVPYCMPAGTTQDGWPEHSQCPPSKENIAASLDGWPQDMQRTQQSQPVMKDHVTAAAQGTDPWDTRQFASQTNMAINSRTSDRQPAHDFMSAMASQQVQDDEAAWRSPDRISHQNVAQQEEMAMWGSQQGAMDAAWGSPQPQQAVIDPAWGSPQGDPFFSPNGQFEMLSGSGKRLQGDVFDPFGEEEDMNFQSGQLFSEPTDEFVAVETFSPPTFAPVPGSNRYNHSHAASDVFDTYYHPQQGPSH